MNIRTFIDKFTSRNPVASYTRIFLAAVLYTFGVQSFLNIGGTFSAGMGAFAQLFSFVIPELKSYFSIIYIAINIPLIIFFWRKSKKSFVYRTTFFLLAQALVGAVYFIPSINNELTNLMGLKETGTLHGSDSFISRHTKPWAILIYALVGAVLVGFAQVVSWKAGGSSAGTDFIGYYYSTKRHQAIGSVLFKISFVIAMFSVAVTLIIDPVDMNVRTNWLMLLIATLGYISITSTMMNMLYPKYSKVRLEIHSTKYEEIVKVLKREGFPHAFNINKEVSGFTGEEKAAITSVVLLLEVKSIIRTLHIIDPNVWISETRVRRVFGTFVTSAVE